MVAGSLMCTLNDHPHKTIKKGNMMKSHIGDTTTHVLDYSKKAKITVNVGQISTKASAGP